MLSLPWDNKALINGKVVDKRVRHNLCFSPVAQEPDYEQGKGRIISLSSTPTLNCFMSCMRTLLPLKASNLVAEGVTTTLTLTSVVLVIMVTLRERK
jgi:hypothetical protein